MQASLLGNIDWNGMELKYGMEQNGTEHNSTKHKTTPPIITGGRTKNNNKIHSDHFPIELKSKETGNCVSFDSNLIGK